MHLVSGVARGPGSPRQVERVLYVAADVWAVLVRSERYRGVALKRREQGLGFAGQKLVADGVQAVAPLLRLVVRCEHRGEMCGSMLGNLTCCPSVNVATT